jgi:glycosyltransferase involved in cell wall biosynthesis
VKVLHVETGRNLYGGALQVLYLVRGLAERGIENVLVCPTGSRIAEEARDTAGKVLDVRMAGDLDLRFVFTLMGIIRRESPDIVHLHSRRGADVLGGIAARLCGAKTILSRRVDNPEGRIAAWLKYRLYHRVITISEGIRAVLLKEGLPAGKVTCVRSAVDLENHRLPCGYEWFRDEFGVPEGYKVVGAAAQFIRRKGHRSLLEAVPSILRFFPKTRFVLFGKGPLEEELRELCLRLGIGEHVIFAGFRDDLARALPCLHVLVHPAELEGLGVVLLQAAASRVPVVAADAGGIPEIVRSGVNGILVPPRDPGAIADAVVKVLNNPGMARSMGHAGRRIVEEEFSTGAMAKGNLRVYREVLGHTG